MRYKVGGAKEDSSDEEGGREGEGEGGSEEEGEGKRAVWGKRKTQYYSADNVDFELQLDEETGAQEEEEEALRLQREQAMALRPEDYEQEEEEEDEEEEGERGRGEETLLEKAMRRGKEGGGRRGVEVEDIEKDVAGLSNEDQMAALMR